MTKGRFVRFCAVGAANTLVHMGTAWMLVRFADLHPLLANVCAFLVANIGSFVANASLTFAVNLKWARYPRFLSVSASGLLISTLLVAIAGILGVHYLVAIGIAALVSAALGFWLSARWVFALPGEGSARPPDKR